MTREEHIEKHKELHDKLDELVADWIGNTECLPSKTTVIQLIKWSYKQTTDPDQEES